MKPENIIYATKEPDSLLKIIDFGTSKAFNPSKKIKQKIGTVYAYTLFSLITLHPKSSEMNTMKNATFGVVELFSTFCFVDILLLMLTLILKS